MTEWWKRTRGNQPASEWISFFEDEEYVDSEEFELLEYLIRLTPLTEEVPVPELYNDTRWCNVYEVRHPSISPVGIKRAKYGQLS